MRRAKRRLGPTHGGHPMNLFRWEDFVTRLSRQSGRWTVIGREGDSYDLRPNDALAVRYLSVRHGLGRMQKER